MRPPLRPRDAYHRWRRITTRWHDNDQYGHVNNTVYYAWFDTAVNEELIAAGLLDPGGKGAGGDLPIGLVVETGCRYASPLAFPGEVEIGLAIAALGRSSVTWHLGVFASGAQVASAEGHFTHVYVDRDARRAVATPDRLREALMMLQEAGDA